MPPVSPLLDSSLRRAPRPLDLERFHSCGELRIESLRVTTVRGLCIDQFCFRCSDELLLFLFALGAYVTPRASAQEKAGSKTTVTMALWIQGALIFGGAHVPRR